MSIRTSIGNILIDYGRSIGRSEDSELAVTISDHSIKIKMVDTSLDTYAWDDTLYRYGNVFVSGYANPIKPTVNHNKQLEDPDTVDIEEGGDDESDESDDDIEVIASPRYRDYMRQDLISQLLNPREQWRMIAYGIIALAILVFVNVVISLSAAGAF